MDNEAAWHVVLGMLSSAAFMVGVSFLNCTQTGLAVTVLTLAASMNGVGLCGFFVNHIDIAPSYAGTLMGISNGIAAASGFIAPIVAAVVTVDVSLRYQWICCAICRSLGRTAIDR